MKVEYVLAIAYFVAYAKSVSYYGVVAEEWEEWKLLHNKSYMTIDEDHLRMKIFMDNKVQIAKHNALAHQGDKGYFLKMNQFGDLLYHEFRSLRKGVNFWEKEKRNDGITYIAPANVELPDEVDWRDHGAVTDVKDQGDCGSCWAFAATGSLEGQHFRKTGKLTSLSEQNLIDCSTKNNGCDGGFPDQAFRYVWDNGGIDTEASYPYHAVQGSCNYNPANAGATVKMITDITPGDEEELKAAVATVGPISVLIDSDHDSFRFYSHGIYDQPECDDFGLDHAVLVVGYGTDDKGNDYWIVKNSWSTTWGDQGYIKMSRNRDNQCGIAYAASFPVM